MGSGASTPRNSEINCSNFQLSEKEINLVYDQTLQVVTTACSFMDEGNETKPRPNDVFVQVVESKFALKEGAFANLIKKEGGGGGGSEAAASGESGDTLDVKTEQEREKTMATRNRSSGVSRLSRVELEQVINLAGIMETMEDHHIEKLHDAMEALIDQKEHEERLHWKALELLGDEDLIQHQRELPPDHSVSSKALSKLGTSKAVESKKIRDRLGSDMSADATKRQQIAELRERKQSEKEQSQHGG